MNLPVKLKVINFVPEEMLIINWFQTEMAVSQIISVATTNTDGESVSFALFFFIYFIYFLFQ